MLQLLFLGLLVTVSFGDEPPMQSPLQRWVSGTQLVAARLAMKCYAASHASPLRCLPNDINLRDQVVAENGDKANITVEKQLAMLKARCRKGKLVDGKRREIRFFKLECWGNPPADYQETQKARNEELAKLKQHYTVIVIRCDPRSVV